MKIYRINEGFEGTWDEALYSNECHVVRELTEEEEIELEEYGYLKNVSLDDDMEFISE